MGKAMPLATFSEGRLMTPEELRQIGIFADVDEKALLKYPGAVRKRLFAAGDVICREGEGGTTAFYIVEGSARVFIGRRLDAARNRRRKGLIARVGEWFGQRRLDRPPHPADKLIPIDATVDLRYGDLAATLHPGDVFGEMSCLNLAPRSATVVAETDCEMIEVLRNVYELLQRSKTFKAQMDQKYRERALDNHLRNVPLFESLDAVALGELKSACELISVEAGAVIFNEGDPADAMYILRVGQVRVSKKFPGGERQLAYLTRGDFFGETALLRAAPRNATCTAVDHPIAEAGGRKRRPARVELVRISAETFDRVIRGYPDILKRLEEAAERRVLSQVRAALTILPSVPAKQVEDLGLLQGQNLMLIDLEKCTRCDQCAQACSEAHDDGISRLIREGPRYDRFLVPSSCRMCMDPVCMIGCPVGSIRRTEDLNIFIEDWCVGCGVCAKQCPYNSIQLHPLESFGEDVSQRAKRVAETGEVVEVTERAVVCDQCSSLPTGPACVYACPHDAAVRVDARQFLHGSGLAGNDRSAL
ncbi:MAG: cyclic nucleotide-binding domain-containing protein [Phycisphaerales bacterium]|nr:cyclic nucleotide-binding domain-containing protein [Phycisphaerales bacterium]